MSNTISSWFIPFWYHSTGGEKPTAAMVNKRREELKANNEAPSFPQTLTPAKIVAGGVGTLGLIIAAYGAFKDNVFGKKLGVGATILGAVGYFIDKLLVKNTNDETNSNEMTEKLQVATKRASKSQLDTVDEQVVKSQEPLPQPPSDEVDEQVVKSQEPLP
ncbi:MAG: hypothetical protein HYZ79_01710, partial [Candidatus Melainabacteria bacterium]|nr:hypothetical protein [Candidatus Melainabacteria bacterium]